MVGFSIILPSRDGSDTLPLVLEALAKIERPPEGLEILLVDNASTDHTADLLREWARNNGGRVLRESRPGKSFALNMAIEEASGAVLVFLDDDAVPCAGWMTAYRNAAAMHPDIGLFAGQVRPHWIAPPPDWLAMLADRGQSCGCTAVDTDESSPYPSAFVKGANFAVRRQALGQMRFGIGESNFGASGRAIGGEDTGLARALENRGVRLRYVSAARVDHVIGPQEMTKGAVFSRYVRIGRSAVAVDRHPFASIAIAAIKSAAYAALWLVSRGVAQGRAITGLGYNVGKLDTLVRSQSGDRA